MGFNSGFKGLNKFDVHESVHRDTTMKVPNKLVSWMSWNC